jgi:hypothetical protein
MWVSIAILILYLQTMDLSGNPVLEPVIEGIDPLIPWSLMPWCGWSNHLDPLLDRVVVSHG